MSANRHFHPNYEQQHPQEKMHLQGHIYRKGLSWLCTTDGLPLKGKDGLLFCPRCHLTIRPAVPA